MEGIIVNNNNIQILDAYKYSKKEIDNILNFLEFTYPLNTVIKNRTIYSMKMEILTHILFYKLNILKNRTKDVDINYPINKFAELLYICLGSIYSVFKK